MSRVQLKYHDKTGTRPPQSETPPGASLGRSKSVPAAGASGAEEEDEAETDKTEAEEERRRMAEQLARMAEEKARWEEEARAAGAERDRHRQQLEEAKKQVRNLPLQKYNVMLNVFV